MLWFHAITKLHHRHFSQKSPRFCEAIQDGILQKLSQKTKISSALALKALLLPELMSF